MAVPETLTRQRVKELFDAEFDAEGFAVENDKIGRSAGMEIASGARAACSPERAQPQAARMNVLEVPVVLQLYLAYEAEPDETIVVDPAVIEGYGDRIRRMFNGEASTGLDDDLWYLQLSRIEYPDDPTGNKSRLEAYISGFMGNPPAL